MNSIDKFLFTERFISLSFVDISFLFLLALGVFDQALENYIFASIIIIIMLIASASALLTFYVDNK